LQVEKPGPILKQEARFVTNY